MESVYRYLGQRLRPFSASAEVRCRGCSLPLQRVLTDLGADHAFARVPHKLKEHYGFELATSTIRRVTEQHAQRMHESYDRIETKPPSAGVARMVAETDGSLIPIVTTDPTASDRRKGKKQSWKEARLCLAHESGSALPYFGVEFQESVDAAGKTLFDCACHAGFGNQTYLHAVGDGAPWIAEQVERHFGAQGHYLVDFYHVCEYISAAATRCAGAEKAGWIEQQQAALKRGEASFVLAALEPHREEPEIDDAHAPVRACYRYLSNRLTQLDYPSAQNQGLPVGSGEIESAHRSVIQERLKRAGAWWNTTHARHMLSLRVTRANGLWEAYWQDLRQVA